MEIPFSKSMLFCSWLWLLIGLNILGITFYQRSQPYLQIRDGYLIRHGILVRKLKIEEIVSVKRESGGSFLLKTDKKHAH